MQDARKEQRREAEKDRTLKNYTKELKELEFQLETLNEDLNAMNVKNSSYQEQIDEIETYLAENEVGKEISMKLFGFKKGEKIAKRRL